MSQHRVALLQSQWCLEGGGDFPTGDGGGSSSRGIFGALLNLGVDEHGWL